MVSHGWYPTVVFWWLHEERERDQAHIRPCSSSVVTRCLVPPEDDAPNKKVITGHSVSTEGCNQESKQSSFLQNGHHSPDWWDFDPSQW